jgi:hypothetical protein
MRARSLLFRATVSMLLVRATHHRHVIHLIGILSLVIGDHGPVDETTTLSHEVILSICSCNEEVIVLLKVSWVIMQQDVLNDTTFSNVSTSHVGLGLKLTKQSELRSLMVHHRR